jgi:exportin-5
MFTPGSVSLLREVYNWTLSDMDVNDLDDQKYTLCKKLSEVRCPAPPPTITDNNTAR